MPFKPFMGYVEVEPITSESIIATDEKKFVEAGRVVQTRGDMWEKDFGIKIGDVIFFRPHGFFETPEYEGKKHYVVRVSDEFILGNIIPDVAEKQM